MSVHDEDGKKLEVIYSQCVWRTALTESGLFIIMCMTKHVKMYFYMLNIFFLLCRSVYGYYIGNISDVRYLFIY